MRTNGFVIKTAAIFVSVGVLATAAFYSVSAQTDITVDPFLQRNDQVKALLNQITDKKSKIDNLKSASDDYAKKIEEAQQKGKTLQNQVGILDNLLTKIQLDIQTNQLQIDKNNLEISALEYEIDKEQQDIAASKDQLSEYIKLIHKNDQQTYLETLLLHNSFSEFFTQLNTAEELQADVRKTVDQLKLLKDALEARKADLANKQDELNKAKLALVASQASYQDDITAKQSLLADTRSSEQVYQRLLVQGREQQSEIGSDILNIQDSLKRQIDKLRTAGTTPKTTLVSWPVDHSRGISAYFHDPSYPFRHVFEHPAIDIRAYQGTPINAPADGYVAKAVDNGYGYSYISIIHDNNISTVYGHVSKIMVRPDQFIKAGQVIGLTGGKPGSRGAGPFTTGPHLHFEVRLNGIPVNPLDYLP